MDKDLISTALEYSPHVLKTRRKKKKTPVAVSKLSLKHRSVPKPPPTFALTESNSSTRDTSSNRSRNEEEKENQHPLLCRCNDCLITSDSSGSQDHTLRQVRSAQQGVSVSSSNAISEDEDFTPQMIESDARTTVTHSTYVTCVSKQTRTDQIQDEIEDEVDVLQSSFKTLVLTPDNSHNNAEVSSCEKVKQWLKRMNVSSSSINIEMSEVNRSHISESSSEDENKRHSLAKTSSSGYPNTVSSARHSNVLEDSLHATSRQSSSGVDQSQSNSSFFNSQRLTRNQTAQETESDIQTQESLPDRNSGNHNRDSIISTVTSSQTTSVGTRSSSLYFIDRPPWSKQNRKSSQIPRPSLANLSDIREQNEATNRVSNISTHDSTLSSDASFHLVYSETISPQGNVSQTKIVSPEITPDMSEESPDRDDRVIVERNHDDTIPLPEESSMSIISNSTRNSFLPKRFIPENQNKKKSTKSSAPPSELPTSSVSVISNSIRYSFKPRKGPTQYGNDQESFDRVSLPDTIPFDEFSMSNVSTSTRYSRASRRITSRNLNVIRESPDKISLPDTIPYVETSNSNISSTTRNPRPQRKVATKNTKTIRESVDKISLPDTIPYVETSDSNVSSTTRNSRPQTKVTSQNTRYVQESADIISLPDTIPYIGSSDSCISNSIKNLRIGRRTTQNTKESSQSRSIPDTIPLPASGTTDSLSSPDVHIDQYAAPVNVASSGTDVFSWPLYSKTELNNMLQNIVQQNEEKEKSNSEREISSTSSEEEDAQEKQHRRTTFIQTSTELQVETYRNSQEGSSEDSASEVRVTASRNLSVIEISSSDEIDDTSPASGEIKVEESSDSEAESPFRLFRRRPNRASYVEIVISESEESDIEQDKNNQDENVSSSSDSEIINQRSKDKTRPAIEISESDSSPELVQKTKRSTRMSSVEVQTAENDSDSQRTYFSQAENETQLQTQVRMSRVDPDPEQPEISEDEDQDPAVRRLDFDDEESSEEEEIQSRVKKTSRKKSSSGESNQSNTSKKLSRPAKLSKSPFKSPPVPQPSRKFNVSSDSSENDERLEQFFQSERKKREQKNKHNESMDDSPNFIVSDNEDIGEDLEDVDSVTPSFYLRVLNEELRRGADKKWQPPTPTRGPKKNFATPTPTKGRTAPKTAGRVQTKPRFMGDSMGGTTFSPVLSFLASLSHSNHTRCHPEAVPYVKRFKSTKEHLTKRLFTMFNEKVFKEMLPSDMSITWNNRLRSTAGFCYNKRKPLPGGEYARTSRIELSAKILHDGGRLRDTLIHEMCHAATWVISGQLGGHGPVWKEWTRKARRCFPELPEISRCHSYEVKTKFTYRCTQCGYSFGRHTNSLDIRAKVCGLCRGKFEVLVNGNPAGTNTAPRQPNVFALFVRENYRIVKNNRKSLKHGDVMKMLSQKFAEQKIAQK